MNGGESDALSAFEAENRPAKDSGPRGPVQPAFTPKPPPAAHAAHAAKSAAPTLRVRWPSSAASAFLAMALAAGGLVWAYQQFIPVDAASPRLAKLNLVTEPAGADVLINGQMRGVTPLSLSLAPGTQTVTLRRGTDERVVPLTLAAGADVTHHIDLAPRAVAASEVGGMSVVTDPPGAQVEVDGRARGVSPLALKDLASADHRVRVVGATGSAERTVTVTPGTTTSVMFALPRVSSPVAGWLTVASPFDVAISEGSNLVGTGKAARIMLPAGRHTISLSNDALQYQAERTIEVAAGQTATVRIDAPKVPVSANARPWADVTVDGASVGQTPIANLSLTIGSHEILFRHPQLGDRRQTLVVTARGPNRIAVDLTK